MNETIEALDGGNLLAGSEIACALAGCRVELIYAAVSLHAQARLRGWDFTIAQFGGLRTERQTARALLYRDADYRAYVRGLRAHHPEETPVSIEVFRPINAFGASFHNYGAAFDVEPIGCTYAALGGIAPGCGLRWGGLFVRKDLPHMQLSGLTLEAVREDWLALGFKPGLRSA